MINIRNLFTNLFLLICLPLFSLPIQSENITVIGIGRLGICFALCLEKAGYNVLGVDLSPDYINQINSKKFQSSEPEVSHYLQESNNFRATTSLEEAIDFSDIVFITLATPTTAGAEAYDHTFLSDLLTKINSLAPANKHIVVCCTVFPGYLKNTATPLLQNCINTTLSYNPAFIAQGNIIYGLENPDMVLIGEGSKEAGDILETIHNRITQKSPSIARMSPESGEITKLALNCFITMKIAYTNLVADIADKTEGANKLDILKAIGLDSRVGSKCLFPGYGFGGPCFPRDNRALSSYALLTGIEPTLFRATDTTNQAHAQFQAQLLLDSGSDSYVFDDVCYKPRCPVPIIEESQKLVVAKHIAEQGKEVVITDREPVISEVQKSFGDLFKYLVK
ncbi:MAG: nucleotide sugar dehydrogenase [Parachlamydiaceae bacterium]